MFCATLLKKADMIGERSQESLVSNWAVRAGEYNAEPYLSRTGPDPTCRPTRP